MLAEGQAFPEFELKDQSGQLWSIDRLAGKPFVIYFYPKDDTSGCTIEACEFRDVLPSLPGTTVLGVSPDGEKSHLKFAKKFDLNFPLLVDEDKTLCLATGVWVEKSMYGRKYMGVERTTFLVGADGIVIKVWNKVKPVGHAAEVKSIMSRL